MKKLFCAVFLIVVFLGATGLVGAYGAWEPETDAGGTTPDFGALHDSIASLQTSIELAERNRSAHPDFLADLYAILADLQSQARTLESQCQCGTGTPRVTQRPGEPQHWSFSGSLSNDKQSERYSIELQDNGDLFLTVTTGGDLNLYGGVFVYDRDGTTRLYGTNQGPGSTVEHHVPNLRAGTYYVEFVKDGRTFYHGPYDAAVRFQPASVPNASGENWTVQRAFDLPLGAVISGHMGYRGQERQAEQESWYRVQVPNNGHVKVTVTTSGQSGDQTPIRLSDGSLNLYGGVFLMDSDSETRLYGTNQGPGTTVEHTVSALRAGTYYVRIVKDGRSFYWGTYTIKVEAIPFSRASDPEPNDSPTDRAVGVIRPGQTVTGDLGTRGQGLPVDMQDYWRYEHPGGNLRFSVQTSGGESPDKADGDLNLYGRVALYAAADLDRAIVSAAHHPGVQREYEANDLSPGTYYIRLEKDGRSFYWGTYVLRIL